MTCVTDNQGNSFLLDKLLTTKYALGVVLMELAVQLGRRNAVLRANLLPRLQNEEADALTNSDFRHFKAESRVEGELQSLLFTILNHLFSVGDAYIEELNAEKSREKARKLAKISEPKRKKSEALRAKDPW